MRIGILTFHRADNYGAVLQCYALQQVLKSLGVAEVEVIDYRQSYIYEIYKPLSLRLLFVGNLKESFNYAKKSLKKFLLFPQKGRYFNKFRENYLIMSRKCTFETIPQDYDVYVIGSDQLWGLHCLGGHADSVYTARFSHPDSSKVIGYAISADMKSMKEQEKEFPLWIRGFDAVSMREKAAAEYLSSVSGVPCQECLDPTLLAGPEIWNPVIDKSLQGHDFVLVYEVAVKPGCKGLLRRKAAELASRIGNGCKVVDLSSKNVGVNEFVSYFKFAKYVVTSSFHGVAFSLLFERSFYAFPLDNGHDLRYRSLLSKVGALQRMVSEECVIMPVDMDFSDIRANLSKLREESLMFLERNIF